jgi:hypothetical protein
MGLYRNRRCEFVLQIWRYIPRYMPEINIGNLSRVSDFNISSWRSSYIALHTVTHLTKLCPTDSTAQFGKPISILLDCCSEGNRCTFRFNHFSSGSCVRVMIEFILFNNSSFNPYSSLALVVRGARQQIELTLTEQGICLHKAVMLDGNVKSSQVPCRWTFRGLSKHEYVS